MFKPASRALTFYLDDGSLFHRANVILLPGTALYFAPPKYEKDENVNIKMYFGVFSRSGRVVHFNVADMLKMAIHMLFSMQK